jgi:hypothetical protein
MDAASTAEADYKRNCITGSYDILRLSTHLDVDKFDKRKAEACHGNFVFDQNDPLHAFGTLFAGAIRRKHRLMDGLGARKGI